MAWYDTARNLLKQNPLTAPFVNAYDVYNTAKTVDPAVRSLMTQTPATQTFTSPSATSGFSSQASAGGGSGGGTSITPTPARTLNPDEINNLNAAYKRIQSGMGSTADKVNVDYARNKGMWSPPSGVSTVNQTRDIVGGTSENTNGLSQNISSSAINPETSTRPLITGNQQIPNQAVQSTSPPVDTAASWQKAMTDLLRGAQGQGLDTDLLAQRNALIQARFGAQTAMTPEQLRVLSPSAQAGLRGQDVSGLESQLSGVQTALQSRGAERDQLRQVMENAQNRLAQIEEADKQRAYETQQTAEQRTYEQNVKLDEPLSYEEAAALGVPYGTTQKQAAAMGIIPSTGGGTTKFEPVKDKDGNTIGAFDPSTGETTYYSGQVGGQALEVSQEAQGNIDLVNELLNDPNLNGIVGLGAWNPLNKIPGTPQQLTIAKFNQLKNAITLDSRQKLKGQGQISDFESKMLEKAATSLNQNLSDEDTRKVLNEINLAFQVGALGTIGDTLGFTRDEIKKAVEDNGYEATKAYLQGFNPAPNTALKGSISKEYPQGSKGGQCTTWLHGIAEFPPIGDSLQEKVASVQKYGFTFNEQSPKVGDIIVTSEDKRYGHTAMIIAIDPYGMATLAESNFASPDKVTYTRKISLNSSKIYGAIRPRRLKLNNLA